MKRLNTETGTPFKMGYLRKDGKVFFKYKLDRPLTNEGFYKEVWYSPEQFDIWKLHQNNRISTVSGRANRLIHAAKTRGDVLITEDWVIAKIECGFCEISGLPFDMTPHPIFNKNPFSPSLDRINALDKTYSEENTRVVLSCINDALNQYGLEHFLKIAEAVLKKQRNQICRSNP